MPQFTFTDSQTRSYPTVINKNGMLVAVPGVTYELAANPNDGRFTEVAATTAPTPTPAPTENPLDGSVTAATPASEPTTTPTV